MHYKESEHESLHLVCTYKKVISVKLLWTRWWSFVFLKTWGISRQAERQLTSKEGRKFPLVYLIRECD